MTTKDYQRKRPLAIFLHYFKNHKKLFFLDICCAVLISCVDLAFPLVTRTALYDLLPETVVIALNEIFGNSLALSLSIREFKGILEEALEEL